MAHATHRCSATMRQCSSQYASTSQSPTAALASPGRCWQPQRPSLRPSTRRAITIASVVTTDRQSTASKSTGRIVLESEEELRSTPTHRAIVYGCSGLLAALALHGLADIHTPADGVATALGVVAAYLLAGTRVDNRVQQLSHHACTDLGTGIYHWSVDNYGDGNTPIVGDQIAAFQGHHQRPWTITEREFCNNVHKVFKPALPFAALFLAASPLMPAPLEVSLALFIWLACMSQQFHAWSHMKASELHPAVLALQNAGVLISRRAHGAHHKAPFEGNYCIVSGIWNNMLDDGGSEQGFFRRLERVVFDWTGVAPRCWSEPNYELFDGYYKDGSGVEGSA